MRFHSTRGSAAPASFTETLLTGLAPDGGLYLPEQWQSLDFSALKGRNYSDIAASVLETSTAGEISGDDLRAILADTYTPERFGSTEITPLRLLEDGVYLLELFHGPTLAFKDIALQLLGRLFDEVLRKAGRRLTVIGATSGDTGSAAIAACRGREQITITILHPKGRTSDVQRRQMTTVLDRNVRNLAVDGTFDDCQALVKRAFADPALRDLNLAAINSINWTRIIAQTVYYVVTCARLGGAVDFAVPTGNFGNVYAAYVARKLGVPIGRLVIGSNRNDSLTRFFASGEMTRGEVTPSLSPSMDIQVSSNFERYLYELLGEDGTEVGKTMDEFARSGGFRVSPERLRRAQEDFFAVRCTDEETLDTIRDVHSRSGVLIDPHTAVGVFAARRARRAGHVQAGRPLVVLACAHPAKFPEAVYRATGLRPELPARLADLMQRPERYRVVANDYAAFKMCLLEPER